MSTRIDIVFTRLKREEGERQFAYDDATGARVRAPQGFLSWGRGFNLDACGSAGLFDVMERYLIGLADTALQPFQWYQALDDVRASVVLDIAYNGGVGGLLHYPHMISALKTQDWAAAAKECAVANEKLDATRYAPLRKILLSGVNA